MLCSVQFNADREFPLRPIFRGKDEFVRARSRGAWLLDLRHQSAKSFSRSTFCMDPNQPPNLSEQPDIERPASVAPTEKQLERQTPTIKALDQSPAPATHDPYAALRYRDYSLFSLGWMVAVMGNQITAAAIAWEVYDRLSKTNPEHAKLALGYVAGIQAVPSILLALPAGALADRFDRRRVLQLFGSLAGFCAFGLAYFSYRPSSIPMMYGILLAYASALSLARPARTAIVPSLVPLPAYSNAITWNASFFQTAAMIGPALGGFIIQYSLDRYGSVRIPYIIDGVCSLFFGVVALMVSPLPQTKPKSTERKSKIGELLAGIVFVKNTKVILATITLDLFAVLLGGAVYLLPVFAKDILHIDARGFGWLRAADAMGAVSMAFLMAHLPPMKKAGRSMLLAVTAFGAATIVFGLSHNFWLSFGSLFLIGAFDNVSVVVRHTLVQVLTPDAMRGRVSAVNSIFIGASNELGGLESGLTAAWLGPVRSVVFGGIGTLLTVLSIFLIFPQINKIGRLDEQKPI
jgi:MFS family permease